MSELKKDAQKLGVALDDDQVEKLLAYVSLLARWNNTYNLTSIKNESDMMTLHLLDSLSVAKFVTGSTLLDVGAGAGLPGIPLAIALPEVHVTLLDSRGKKTRFMEHAVRTLKLKNADVVQSRVEDFPYEQSFEQIVSRAFSSLDKFYQTTKRLLDINGSLLAMKGALPDNEIEVVGASGVVVRDVHVLNVPGVDAQRHLIELKPSL